MRKQLLDLFDRGGFLLRKWISSDPTVIEDMPPELKAAISSHAISAQDGCTKTLGIEWNSVTDHFRLTVAELPLLDKITKRFLVSDF